ncbi:hypothetical protein J2TS4_30600 [Paenibacillus sp. J2TS4]|nr:hypothetical protein J2TS4_30600 [Paenibacillus sp. J2TS4]
MGYSACIYEMPNHAAEGTFHLVCPFERYPIGSEGVVLDMG